jgi:hypothetical protein
MAERFISPGVFTQERDLSFLPQGIAQIGAAFVGPTQKGPAFRPVIVESQEEFTAIFGGPTVDFYTPHAVQNYLREAGRATVCRVLGLDGYDNSTVESLILSISGSGSPTGRPIGVIFPSRQGVSLVSGSASGAPTQFTLTISGASGVTTYNSMSVDPTSANYFAKVLGTTTTTGQDGFVLLQFPSATSFVSGALVGSGSMTLAVETTQLMLSGSTYGTYRNAETPWIRSQLIGSIHHNLFKFHTLSDGTSANTDVKISIASIRPNPSGTGYGTFTVLVRKFDDTDARINVLEQFDNLTMDPSSPNYVARAIGTARTIIDANNDIYLEGEYENKSKYVYVEMDSGAEDVSESALPYGFAPLAAPLSVANLPAPAYVTTRYAAPTGGTTEVASNRVYYGIDLSDDTTLAYIAPIPSGSINSAGTTLRVGVFASGSTAVPAGGVDPGFDLLEILESTDLVDVGVQANTAIRKFTVPFQNGFDGQNPSVLREVGGNITSTNTQGFDLSDSNKAGSRAYKLCIDALANPDAFDINMLVLPGVIYSQHAYIVTEGINMCENRGDCFFVLDGSVLGATVATAETDVEDLDTNYAGTYYPWVKIRDTDTNKLIWAPPSVVMPNVFAFNDRVAAEWFAPAGLQRGGIDIALQVRTRVDQSDRDSLYEARVNPIASFPGQGIVAWGQKTLQQDASALDRINVRRLLIAVKKFIASSSRYLVFEQNVESTRQRFLSIVNPYLQSVQERSGLYAFKVVMDETNNTPDIIDRNVLVGQLYLQPTKTAEIISLDFNILSTGAVFPEA